MLGKSRMFKMFSLMKSGCECSLYAERVIKRTAVFCSPFILLLNGKLCPQT